MNRFAVGAVGKKIQINNLAPRPTLTPEHALELAAWLAATALGVQDGDHEQNLGKFLELVVEASDGQLNDAMRAHTDE